MTLSLVGTSLDGRPSQARGNSSAGSRDFLLTLIRHKEVIRARIHQNGCVTTGHFIN
jgi:hypothetical protein